MWDQNNPWKLEELELAFQLINSKKSLTYIGQALGITKQAVSQKIYKTPKLLKAWKKQVERRSSITSFNKKEKLDYLERKRRFLLKKIYFVNYKIFDKMSVDNQKLWKKRVSLWKVKKGTAKVKGIEFRLKFEDIYWPTHCPVLGLKLNYLNSDSPFGLRFSNSPSFDRFNPKEGYIKGNVYIISNRANTLKNDASYAELKQVIQYMKKPPNNQTSFKFVLRKNLQKSS